MTIATQPPVRSTISLADDDHEQIVIRQDYHDGVPSVAGRYRLDDFGATLAEAFRAGRTVAMEDVAIQGALTGEERANYAAAAVRAHATVCLVKDDRQRRACPLGDATPAFDAVVPRNLGARWHIAQLRERIAPGVLDEPADWNLCRRMIEAGVRIGYVDRVVVTWYPSRLFA